MNNSSRLLFIDNIRSVLIILVVLHHFATIYGATPYFYYVEPADEELVTLLLVLFQLFNQAYFMGFLFLISGLFTPGSFDRRGPGGFLKNRLLHLGVPILVFYFILNPLSCIGIYQMPEALSGVSAPFVWYRHFGMGPLWFTVLLLIFDLAYWGWHITAGNRPAAAKAAASSKLSFRTVCFLILKVCIFILLLAAASYLFRINVPIGKYVLGFPSLAYLPQYLSFFLIGTIAGRRNWLDTLPNSLGIFGFVLTAAATPILLPRALLNTNWAFFGGGHWQSGVYALWDSIFSVGVCLAYIVFFRRFFDRQKKFGRFLSQHSYAVYIFHMPIIVFLAIALRGLQMEQLLKFCLAAFIGVPLCFASAWLIRKIPFAKRIF